MKVVKETLNMGFESAIWHFNEKCESIDEENRATRQYTKLWNWSTIRYSGEANRLQASYINKYGWDKFVRRMNRVRRVLGLLEF